MHEISPRVLFEVRLKTHFLVAQVFASLMLKEGTLGGGGGVPLSSLSIILILGLALLLVDSRFYNKCVCA